MLNDGMKSCNSEEWATPQDFYDRLNEEFHFTLDPCCTDENAKCEKHYTKEQDGLAQDWTGETVFCNPPYGKGISAWCKKCYEHSLHGGVAVMLIHARTDTAWFHDWVYGKAEIRFVRGRLHFGGSKWNAPFPSMIAIYNGKSMKEKVINEWENVLSRDPLDAPWNLIDDTLTLLKELETERLDFISAVAKLTAENEMLKKRDSITPYIDIDEAKCPFCKVKLTRQELLVEDVLFEDFYDYCPHCGRQVKWE